MSRRIKPPRGVYADKTSGGYYAQVPINGKRKKIRGRTPEEVVAKRDEFLGHLKRGYELDGLTITVAQLLQESLAEKHRSKRSAKATTERDQLFADHLNQLWGHRPAAGLHALEIRNGLWGKLDQGLSANYVGRMRATLAAAYRWGKQYRILDVNPAADSPPIPGASKAVSDAKPLNRDQALALLAVARPHRLAVVPYIGLHCGLRVPEIRGLLLSDVDLEARTLSVTGQADKEGNRGDAKNHWSPRTLPIGDGLAVVLAEHLERLRAEEALGQWPPSDLLIRSETGTPINASNLLRLMGQWAKQADLGRPVRTKDLRSTFGSLALNDGAWANDVRMWMGHADGRVLEIHYGRALTNVHHRAALVAEVLG